MKNITIAKAAKLLLNIGYILGTPIFDHKEQSTSYSVTFPSGEKKMLSTKEIKKMVS